jgi:6-phosphogluconolactonase
MRSKGILAVTAALILGSGGCSTRGCPTSTPGTTGTASGTSSGRPMPNNCPAPASTGSSSALVYSRSANGTELIAAGLDEAGSLLPVNSFTSPTLPISDSRDMAIVNKEFLYIPGGDTTIQAFRIDRLTGALTATAGSPYTVPTANGKPTVVVADPPGRFLFVGSKNTGEVWAYQIDATSGGLTLIAGSPFTEQFSFFAAQSLTVDAAGRFLYVGQGDPSLGIIGFSIDQGTGTIRLVSGTPFFLGVAQLRADPAAEFLAGTAQIRNQSSSAAPQAGIYRFSIGSDGVPTAVPGSPFKTAFAPYDLVVVPNGKFMFTFGTSTSTNQQGAIEGFQVNPNTGALAMMTGSPFNNLPIVYTCQVDQSGSELFCVNALPGTKFSVLSINSLTGAIVHTGTDLMVNNAFSFAAT